MLFRRSFQGQRQRYKNTDGQSSKKLFVTIPSWTETFPPEMIERVGEEQYRFYHEAVPQK